MSIETDQPLLGPQFGVALVYATELHESQVRKGTATPYISHLLAVTALVLEAGGDEDEAIAALLHDAAEDQGGEEQLAKIERRFGPRVAGIVRECSDTTATEKEPWEVRRQRYAERVAYEMSPGAFRVSLADKLHNATSIVRDHREVGDEVWARFSRGKEAQAERYRGLVAAYRTAEERLGLRSPHLDELERMVVRLEAAVDDPELPHSG